MADQNREWLTIWSAIPEQVIIALGDEYHLCIYIEFFLYFAHLKKKYSRNEPGQNLFSRFDPFQWRQFIWRNLGSSRTMYTGVTTKSHHMHWLDSVRLLSHVSASVVWHHKDTVTSCALTRLLHQSRKGSDLENKFLSYSFLNFF
jgi:hypothetical protein